MSAITTHVLDTALGTPAPGVAVRLERADPAAPGGWTVLGTGVTDADGRVRELGPDHTVAGTHRLVFDTGAYFAAGGRETFFPEVGIAFTVADPAAHHHVPLLLSPFALSTYRGS